jgi:hypothetical protein
MAVSGTICFQGRRCRSVSSGLDRSIGRIEQRRRRRGCLPLSVVHYLSAPLLGDKAIPHAVDRYFVDADRLPGRYHVEEWLGVGSGAYISCYTLSPSMIMSSMVSVNPVTA